VRATSQHEVQEAAPVGGLGKRISFRVPQERLTPEGEGVEDISALTLAMREAAGLSL
jgi:hypothetical protein